MKIIIGIPMNITNIMIILQQPTTKRPRASMFTSTSHFLLSTILLIDMSKIILTGKALVQSSSFRKLFKAVMFRMLAEIIKKFLGYVSNLIRQDLV